MAKLITIANSKGGVGKTTLSLNLASVLCDNNVAMIDHDLQGSLTKLNMMVDGLNLIDFEQDFSKLKRMPFDLIICDTPPYLTSKLPDIFENSDFVLVPTRTSAIDIKEANETIELIKKVQLKNTALKYAVLFNQVMHNSSILNEIKTLLDADTPFFNTTIKHRVDYMRSQIYGGIANMDDNKALNEMIELCAEIFSYLED